MVGHTGIYQATIIGVETVDLALQRIVKAVAEVNGVLIVTADHGNADEMYEKTKDVNLPPKPKTAHTLNPVPFILFGTDCKIKAGEFGLANIAQTVVKLLQLPENPDWLESIIE
jgi:2,3-bisphosphoglycerate-independent phosphoglycerate mutase